MSASTGGDPADLSNLVDSTGAATSIDLAYSTSGTDSGAAGTGANFAGPYPASISVYPQSAVQDGLFFSSDTITLTLGDLDPGSTYDLVLYGARGNNGTGASFTFTGATVANGGLSNAFNNSGEVVEVAGLAPNVSGEITILMATVGAGSSALNVLELNPSDEDPVDPPDPEEPLGPPNPNLDPAKPNVLILYYDDLGYSNVGAYDTTQTSYTPKLDALTNSGLRFDAGYSGDAVCTPSRYGILTGRYCWRTSLKTRVTGGYSSPLIASDRFTMPKMFQELGYTTSMIGKWHIGMQFYSPSGNPVDLGNDADVLGTNTSSTADDEIDFSRSLTHTPNTYGFDYFFGTSASLDMPPYTWIENQTVLFKGGLVSGGSVDFDQATPANNSNFLEGEPIGAVNNVRDGVYDPNFNVSDYLQVQAQKVEDVLLDHSRDGEPFFIYVPIPSPHLPWAVQSEFSGSTPFAYGDYLAQSDYYAGQILDALEDPDGDPLTDDGLDSNTIVFFSSDNGVSKNAMQPGLNVGHDGNGPFRGQKLDNWEGGTRVPFVIRWPGVTTPGATTNHSCWQGDFMATMAEFLNYDFTPDEAVDAESFLPVLKGDPMPAERRAATTQHAYDGQLAILDKDGVWKLLDGTGGNGSNSFDANNVNIPAAQAQGVIFGTPRQLFNLSTDIGETTNLLPSTDPAILAKEQELYDLLNEIRGNTTYGTDGDSNVPPVDSDGDGLPNYFENETSGLDRDDPSDGALDFDIDGLSNTQEFQNGADLYDPDTDDDRVGDALEVLTYGSLPDSDQSDGDGLADGDEVYIWNTDPILSDTDGDGHNDNVELANFSNPRDASSTLTVGAPVTVALDPSVIQLAGSTGTVNDPMAVGSWTESGSIYVRERSTSGSSQQLRTQLFLKFDLASIQGSITEARLRIFQTHRLNDLHSAPLGLGRVTGDWGTTAGSFPVFDSTPVTDAFTFGNNNDFGDMTVDASGFYGGTPGTIGDESGFDPDNRITDMVTAWHDGVHPNHGIRIAFDTPALVGAAFADADDGGTPEDESLQLLVTYVPVEDKDDDDDQLNDDYEQTVFMGLSQSGSDDFDGDGKSNLEEWALGGNAASSGHFPVFGVVPSGSGDRDFSFHRILDAGLGFEVEVSEDLSSWSPFTEFYRYQSPSPVSDLGADYDKVTLEPIVPLPEKLFYQIKVQAVNQP
ncbi:sulfatase-like hydrolase/transferase [Haloferula sp.]|uniref:sulfatase-like hydrolase/transferase n=1 Tax=Haloferula sp. TaxID=2497595 RepID=UPI00329EA3F5